LRWRLRAQPPPHASRSTGVSPAPTRPSPQAGQGWIKDGDGTPALRGKRRAIALVQEALYDGDVAAPASIPPCFERWRLSLSADGLRAIEPESGWVVNPAL